MMALTQNSRYDEAQTILDRNRRFRDNSKVSPDVCTDGTLRRQANSDCVIVTEVVNFLNDGWTFSRTIQTCDIPTVPH